MISASFASTPLIVASSLCAVAAIVLAYRKIFFALIAANFALVLLLCNGDVTLGRFLFWLAASAVAAAIAFMLPDDVRASGAGTSFLVTGALAGMAVGVALDAMTALIVGSAAGALFGALVFGNTRRGKSLGFPSRRYFNYVLAKALPLVVVMSAVGIAAATLIAKI